MAGIETGLDLAACTARLEAGVDAHAVRLLLTTPAADETQGGEEAPSRVSPEMAAMEAMAARRKSRGEEEGYGKE